MGNDTNQIPTNSEDKSESREYLVQLYEIAVRQYDSVWKSYVQAMLISITGILAGFILAFRDMDNLSPAFLIIPPFIMAWYSLIEIQGRGLQTREGYIAMIETKLHQITGSRFPLSETAITPLVYRHWVFRVHVYFVALPFVALYIVSVIFGIQYAEAETIIPGKLLAIVYAAYFIFPFIIHSKHSANIRKRLGELEMDLGLNKINEDAGV